MNKRLQAEPSGTDDDSLDALARAAFEARRASPGSRSASVVTALWALEGGEPRVRLADPPETSAASVALDPNSPELPLERDGGGRYQILGEIARGGIGVVLKTRDGDLGRDVAMKVLQTRYGHDSGVLRRFLEEAQIGGQLQHPGVVPVHEMGLTVDGRPFFTMKLVEGETLADALAARSDLAQDRQRFLSRFAQVCQTLAYAHARGVVHRDLKPANVLIGSFGEVLVVDWGLAKVLSRASSDETSEEIETTGRGASRAGCVLGTPAYMSPEQARGERELVDKRSDVFSLGAILCEILTGAPPFQAEDASEALRQASAGRVEAAVERLAAQDLDAELAALARACLSPAREDRPRDAGEVAAAVTSHLASLDERAHVARITAAEAVARASGERKARRMTVAMATTVLAAVALGAIAYRDAESRRTTRQDRIRAAATEALREAELLRGRAQTGGEEGLASWQEARTAAERARVLLAGEEALEEVQGPIDAFLAAVGVEEEVARAQLLHERAGAALVRDLVALFMQSRSRLRERQPEWIEAEYAAAFRRHGLDLERTKPEKAARWLRDSGQFENLIAFMDEWHLFRRRRGAVEEENADRLLMVLQAADPEPFRAKLRAEFPLIADSETLGEAVLRPLAHPLSYHLLAVCYEFAGHPSAALGVLTTGTEFHPGSAMIHRRIGRLLLLESYREIGALRELSLEHPDDASLFHKLGLRLASFGDHEEAIRAFRRAVALQPDNATHELDFGISLKRAGKTAEALDHLRRAIALDPDQKAAYLNLGSLLRRTEDYEAMADAYAQALRLDPMDSLAINELGLAFAKLDDHEKTLALLRTVEEVRPGMWEIRHNIAVTLWFLDEWEKSIQVLRDLLRNHGENAESLATLADALVSCPNESLRNPVEALDFVQRAIDLDPRDPLHRRTLAKVHYTAGNLEEAERALHEAIEMQEGAEAYEWYYLALVTERLGKAEEAIECFQQGEDTLVESLARTRPEPSRETLRNLRAEAADRLGWELERD